MGNVWGFAAIANSLLALGFGISTVGLVLFSVFPIEYGVGEGCQLRQFGRVTTCEQHMRCVIDFALALVGFALTWVLLAINSTSCEKTVIVAGSEKTY